MALNDINKNAIAFKKSVGKGHTQETFAFTEEKFGSNVQMSLTTVFGQAVNPLPITDGGLSVTGDTDNVVERLRFPIDIIPDTLVGTNQSQGYRLKLPSDYNGVLSSKFSGGTYLHDGLGRLQIVPALYGTLKSDGSTEYDPILYQTDGSTTIPKFDGISWVLDSYNGILFVQTPPAGFDVSATRPGFIEAFLYVGKYGDEVATGGTGSTSGGTALVNVGTGDGQIFSGATETESYIRTLTAGDNMTIITSGDTIIFHASGGGTGSTTIDNIGDGEGEIFATEVGNTAQLRTIKAGENINVTTSGDTIIVSSTGSTTLNNIGDGEGEIYAGESQIRTIKAGDNIDITTSGNTIVVSSTGGGQQKTIEITTVTGYTVSDSSTYHEFVSSGTTLYTLPPSPTTGAQLTFTDGIGVAFTDTIRIDGSGKRIYDDSTEAFINTNFGSLTLSYNGIMWNVIAFVP